MKKQNTVGFLGHKKMTEDEFWNLLESTSPGYESSSSLEIHSQNLLKALNSKTDLELSVFDSYMCKFVEELNFFELWAVGWLIPDEKGYKICSDDSFMNFRAGIVSRGRDVFERVKQDPEALVEVKEPQLLMNSEVFLLAAQTIYYARNGDSEIINGVSYLKTLEQIDEIVGPITGPRGIDWNLEEYPDYFTKRFPKCIEKWGLPDSR